MSHDHWFCARNLLYTDERERARARHSTRRAGNDVMTEEVKRMRTRQYCNLLFRHYRSRQGHLQPTTLPWCVNSPRQLVGAGINLTPGSPLTSPSLSSKVLHGR